MYMRDVADRWGWSKATCLHTPIISNLKSKGARMESFDHKMSKSDPNGAILLHDDEKALAKKLRKAYLDPEDSESPVYELIEHIVLPEQGSLEVVPNPEYGEPSTWTDLTAIRAAVSDGTLHPFDVKMAVASGISSGLSCVSEFFANNPETLMALESLTND
jgi:tryptophanyl-tRNA synthetase